MKIDVLDHGYVNLIEPWGSDRAIIEAARMSTQKGFLGWGPGEDGKPGDEKLLRYLWENRHSTPFEMAGMVIEVQAPIFVFREWHRHRTQCLAGNTMVHFQRPSDGRVYKMPIAEVWRKWQPTKRSERPERQTNAFWNRERIAGMALRCVNEETKGVTLTRIVDVVRSPAKQLYRITTISGHTIRASADHRLFTNLGWLRLEDAVKRDALLAVETTAKHMAEGWDTEPVDYVAERWRDVVGWEGLYEVSDFGRVRRCGKAPKRGTVGRQGYPVVSLNRPGMQQTRTIHALVLEAWHGPRPDGYESRHLNSNRLDARADNLRWGTPLENSEDRVVRGSQQSIGVVFEEIRSFAVSTIEETFDLAVDGPWHNFIADGIVVHNSYNEMSARYAPLPDLNYVPTVERLMLGGGSLTTNRQAGTIAGADTLTHEQAKAFREALVLGYEAFERHYRWALEAGVPKELARCLMPVGRYSRMRASANLRNWIGFLTLRQDSNAQWEIQQFANAVFELTRRCFPRTAELYRGV